MSSGTSTRAAEHADDAESSLVRHSTGRLQIAQFFIILALIAATAAVVMARRSAPENLILISVTIGGAAAVAFAFYRVIVPLAEPAGAVEPERLHDRLRADLEREKMLTLRSIKELEFDRAMGKVSAEDFDEMSARLRARAIGLMKQLDDEGSAYESIIERDVAARLRERVRSAEKDAVKVPSGRQVCTCGVQNDVDARFCKSCGSKLEAG
jgi:ribosomal protein L9